MKVRTAQELGRAVLLCGKTGREIVASRNYEPTGDVLQCCDRYSLGGNDTDSWHARERWP